MKTSWANGRKKHLFPRILEENKQTNKSTLSLCPREYRLIPVDNKNSILIPEQRENRLNQLLKIGHEDPQALEIREVGHLN